MKKERISIGSGTRREGSKIMWDWSINWDDFVIEGGERIEGRFKIFMRNEGRCVIRWFVSSVVQEGDPQHGGGK